MISKVRGFSKYQKDIVKALNKELGTDTPFSFERTNNNHLKILIDGIAKPLYTSCTPSDRRSGENFMGDVKTAIKYAAIKRPVKVASYTHTPQQRKQTYCNKLHDIAIKALRSRFDEYAAKEKQQVTDSQSLEQLKATRHELAEALLSYAKTNHKSPLYLTGKDHKELIKKVLKHITFMFPNAAEYSQQLKPQPPVTSVATIAHTTAEKPPVTPLKKPAVVQQKAAISPSIQQTIKSVPSLVESPLPLNPLQQLLELSNAQRHDLMSQFNNQNLQLLVEDIQQAINKNTQRDVDQVVGLINSNNLPIEQILQQLQYQPEKKLQLA